MNKKEYLAVVILFLIFIIITSSIPNLFLYGADLGINYGFPFNFYGYGGGPPPPSGVYQVPEYFNVINLILDIVVWLIVSYLIVFIIGKVRKK